MGEGANRILVFYNGLNNGFARSCVSYFGNRCNNHCYFVVVNVISITISYALIRILIAMVSKTNAYRINTCHSVELTVCSALR